MAKQVKRNYGADTSLIQGEAAMRQTSGFQNVAAAFDAPMKRMERMGAAIQRKNQARNAKVESYMSALNANIDVTALTEDDQKEVNNYLMGAKDEYAAAASAITNFKAGTPEYMEQLDIMNGVKNGLANLKTELDGFEQSKGDYLDEFKDLSQGNNSGRADTAANIFTGETRFSIGTGGHLHFTGSDGTSIPYTKLKMPFKKDYKQAMGFNDLFTPIYNSGLYDANKQRTFEDRIRIMAESNPDGMKSIIADGLTSHGDYQSLIPLLDDPANQEELTNKFISIASDAARQAANEGKIQKDKKQFKGQGESATHYAPQYYTDLQGRKVSFRESKMPGKYEDITKYLPMGNGGTPDSGDDEKPDGKLDRQGIIAKASKEARDAGLTQDGVIDAVNDALEAAGEAPMSK
jgi:hypothetical protein